MRMVKGDVPTASQSYLLYEQIQKIHARTPLYTYTETYLLKNTFCLGHIYANRSSVEFSSR